MSWLIRPVEMQDLDAVLELASQTGPGMTSLPADRKLLEEKIQDSVNSLKITPTKVGNQSYRFVLELMEGTQRRIIGIAAIRDRIGGFEPFYSYKICRARHQSHELGVDKEVPYLELCKEYDGPSIISSLFLAAEYRGKRFGQFLSQARFLFMADYPERFTDRVIAEMRGVIDQDEKSPFWEATVRHFFDMDFTRADYLSTKDKGFIADLMPKYPIYIPLLRDSAIRVIGEVHEKTVPALKFLEKEGFARDGHVDIFDAGPRIAAAITDIRTVKNSATARIKSIEDISDGMEVLVTNTKLDYRVIATRLLVDNDGVLISRAAADALKLNIGESLRYIEV